MSIKKLKSISSAYSNFASGVVQYCVNAQFSMLKLLSDPIINHIGSSAKTKQVLATSSEFLGIFDDFVAKSISKI